MLENKIATIVPKAHLNLIEDDTLFMALVHACEDQEYFDFFKRQAKQHRVVILDNSTVELGEPYPFDRYLQIAKDMGATIIVLPDYLHDPETTMEQGFEAIKLMEQVGAPGYVMACPQGSNREEWRGCALEMMDMMYVNMIGMSCRYTPDIFATRLDALQVLWPWLAEGYTATKVHLLGCYMYPREEKIHELLESKKVLGIDSSTPCLYTMAGEAMRPNIPHPPHHKIDFLKDKYDEELLRANIALWRLECMGRLQ